jgi:hypothetical protein
MYTCCRVKDSASRGLVDRYLGVATDHVIESFRNRRYVRERAITGSSFAARRAGK